MRPVYIVGTGQTKITKNAGVRGRYLAKEAIAQAMVMSGLDKNQISMLITGNMMSGILTQQQQLGALVADIAGFRGIESATVESACSSGASAARWGVMSVAGGFHDATVVCGIERMTHATREDTTSALATAADWELEGCHGESFISLNAKIMKLYMDTYKVSGEDFGHFAINAHDNGLNNENAFLHKKVDVEMYNNSRMLADPVKLFDAPPVCDGAAAVIIATEEIAKQAMKQGRPVVKILGSAIGTDSLALAGRINKLELSGAKLSTERALGQAKLTMKDMDIFELHDAYTIITSLSLEAAGVAAPGQGVHFGKNGEIGLDGKLPISTMGGLKARGHPVGATGIYQLAETFSQLTGSAGENQIKGANTALVQNIGGTGATVVSHVLQCA